MAEKPYGNALAASLPGVSLRTPLIKGASMCEANAKAAGNRSRGTRSIRSAALAACRAELILADDRVDDHGFDVGRSPIELFGRFD